MNLYYTLPQELAKEVKQWVEQMGPNNYLDIKQIKAMPEVIRSWWKEEGISASESDTRLVTLLALLNDSFVLIEG
ncbi:hypothetical protein WOSG25_110050 [Weissella oryzae SG25]|uniref:Uncharacterized protein n=1 Tax=Weissella oryzae (strain DSM 25784 / JCM 18191 / LMG 30913 / SG25) TaxID=1329250 RepID=A0A069CVV7_WEIOS|nr:hypothetical protein [Weissella oryzae]GAK31527.1 hypothetical protein WOSG25_110050 [Weissella oryzae SG25]